MEIFFENHILYEKVISIKIIIIKIGNKWIIKRVS